VHHTRAPLERQRLQATENIHILPAFAIDTGAFPDRFVINLDCVKMRALSTNDRMQGRP